MSSSHIRDFLTSHPALGRYMVAFRLASSLISPAIEPDHQPTRGITVSFIASLCAYHVVEICVID